MSYKDCGNRKKEKSMIQPTNAQQLYPAQGGGANAVSINIFNPQAYGAPQGTTPAATAPYNYQNSLYAMPQASLYQPQQMAQPMAIPAQYPMYPMMTSPMTMPQQQIYPQVVQQQTAQPVTPAPQMMPESVMTQEVAPVPAAQIQPEAVPVQQQEAAQPAQVEAAQQPAQPEVTEVQTNANAPLINIEELTQGLASPDADVKANTINKIAEYVQSAPETALQVVSEPIMNSLVNIINEDTTSLQGPTDQQIAIAEKIAKGEQLTPEENALSEQLSPRDKANKNRIFALYTLAMIQKLQRDELNQYIETQKANGEQPIEPIAINNLIGYNDIVNVINNDQRPELKVAAIQALQFVAEPQDKATVEAVLANSLNSQDEGVKSAAQEALASFGA